MNKKVKTSIVATTADKLTPNQFPIFINPLTDFGFKRLFCMGRQGPMRMLSFLKAFFPNQMKHVKNITYRPTELLGEHESEKRVIFDVYCITDTGVDFIVEMQQACLNYFDRRIITYHCRVVSTEVYSGDREYQIPTVISFNILNYTLEEFADSKEFFHVAKYTYESGEIFSEKSLICFLELSKFAAKNNEQFKDIIFADERERWAYFLKNLGTMGPQDLTGMDWIFRGMFEDSRESKLTKMEKRQYKKSVLEYEDVQNAILYAEERSLKKGREQGHKEGHEEGVEQGREEGREEGLTAGRTLATIEIAQRMISNGLDNETIAAITGLSLEEIHALTETDEP